MYGDRNCEAMPLPFVFKCAVLKIENVQNVEKKNGNYVF